MCARLRGDLEENEVKRTFLLGLMALGIYGGNALAQDKSLVIEPPPKIEPPINLPRINLLNLGNPNGVVQSGPFQAGDTKGDNTSVLLDKLAYTKSSDYCDALVNDQNVKGYIAVVKRAQQEKIKVSLYLDNQEHLLSQWVVDSIRKLTNSNERPLINQLEIWANECARKQVDSDLITIFESKDPSALMAAIKPDEAVTPAQTKQTLDEEGKLRTVVVKPADYGHHRIFFIERPCSPSACEIDSRWASLFAFALPNGKRAIESVAATETSVNGFVKAIENKGTNGVYQTGGGVTPPTVIQRVEPQYSEEARKARYQGTVVLEVIIRRDGTVDIQRIVRSLGFGLDENAIQALKQWRFRPGMRNGVPVDVSLNIEVAFNLGN
jgi:TonB family protein